MGGARSTAKFLVTRLLVVAAVGLLVSFLTFFALRLSRDPVVVVGASRGLDVRDPAIRARLATELGTNRSLLGQYGSWLSHAVRGDLGRSYLRADQPVLDTLRRALPVNLELVLIAQLIAVVVAIPLGLWAGSRAGRRADRWISGIATALVSYPGFALAIVLISVFAVQLDWFPVSAANYVGFSEDPLANLHQMFLPALSLSAAMIGVCTRVLRSDVAATLQEDFVLMARSRGIGPRRILVRHAFRPSSLSLVSIIGLQSGALLGGSILIEQLFAFPTGLGSALVPAAIVADVPVVLGAATTIAVIFTLITITADLVVRAADPRIRRA